jgi:hypothetical protein
MDGLSLFCFVDTLRLVGYNSVFYKNGIKRDIH